MENLQTLRDPSLRWRERETRGEVREGSGCLCTERVRGLQSADLTGRAVIAAQPANEVW